MLLLKRVSYKLQGWWFWRNKAGANVERLHKAVADAIAAQHDVPIIHRW